MYMSYEDTKGVITYIEEELTAQWPKEKVQPSNNGLQNIHIKLKIE
jgi:hypothetical protein